MLLHNPHPHVLCSSRGTQEQSLLLKASFFLFKVVALKQAGRKKIEPFVMLKLFRASSSTAHIRYFVLEHLNEQWLYKICADKPPTV